MISEELARYIPYSGIAIIIGERGSGKTVLGFSILEWANKQGRPCYVYNFPYVNGIPDYIKHTSDLELVDSKSVVLIDEAYAFFSARRAMSKRNIDVDYLNGISRHKDLLLVYITQDTGRLDLNILRNCDIFLAKRLNTMQVSFERGQLRKFLASVKSELDKLGILAVKSVYVMIDKIGKKFNGVIKNCISLPEFWSENLSKAWSNKNMLDEEGQDNMDRCIICGKKCFGKICSLQCWEKWEILYKNSSA